LKLFEGEKRELKDNIERREFLL